MTAIVRGGNSYFFLSYKEGEKNESVAMKAQAEAAEENASTGKG